MAFMNLQDNDKCNCCIHADSGRGCQKGLFLPFQLMTTEKECPHYECDNEKLKNILKKMNMKKIEIEIPDGKRAEWVDGVLTLVDDVTERIKTFEDAVKELGSEHPICLDYFSITDYCTPDHEAYLKLRIICAALNEGWKPEFTGDECRYYPWFRLYAKTELENMSEEEKKECVMIGTDGYDTEYAGLAYACSANPSYAYTDVGSRLCLKSDTLAGYCGKQFINLWADYLLRRK